MNKLKTFEQFSNEVDALTFINEGILDFTSKQEVTNNDVIDLKKSQDEILNKYDLTDVAKDNIRDRISDAIGKKTNISMGSGQYNISSNSVGSDIGNIDSKEVGVVSADSLI